MQKEEYMKKLEEAFGTKTPKVECPCCGHEGQIYRRKFNEEMAIFLTRLVSFFRHREKWYTISEVLGDKQVGKQKIATDGVYLQHWGLVMKPDKETAKILGGQKGLYQPTEKGIAFVMEAETGTDKSFAPLYVKLYNNKVYGWGPESVTLLDILPRGKEQWVELVYG